MEKMQAKAGLQSDEETIRKILASEMIFFEVLIRRYISLLYKIARTDGFTDHVAEDMMQETN